MSEHPLYLKRISKLVIDEEVKNSPIAMRVRHGLPQTPLKILFAGEEIDCEDQQSTLLYLKAYKGNFFRFCPGTRYYRCCGYRIIHIGENCPLNCSYCILKAYFQDGVQKVWANQEDLWRELEQEFSSHPEKRYRVGTGEFTDSLALEPLTGYSKDLIDFLGPFPNVCLELKSKVVDLSWVYKVSRTDRVLPAWSLNAPEIVRSEERDTTGLEERLEAARECAQLGFRVCLHFDPIIRFPGWRQGYATVIDMIFDYLRPKDICYLSLGSFRGMPELKSYIALNWPESKYIYDEYIVGLDGKLRLLRPLRVEQFRFIADRLKSYGLGRQLYFCMESDEVWRSVLGYCPKDLGGLSNHLLSQAFEDNKPKKFYSLQD